MRTQRRLSVLAAVASASLLIAACGGSSKSGCQGGSMKMSNGAVMCDSAMHGSGSETVKSGSSGKAGKRTAAINVASSASTKVPEVNGVAPVATQVLATTYWQGMEIQAQTRTPVRFIQFSGDKELVVNPPKGASFHLMVMLSDAHTGEPMPYSASVWATITNSAGHTVYNSQQWPMISAYMGPHYGDNVSHLASGVYKLTILIGTPTSARASEYRSVWLKPHNVTMRFRWNVKTATATVIGSTGSAGSSGSMGDMGSMATHTKVPVNGVKATPSKLIATAYWQGMRIQTRRSTPTSVYISDGRATKSIAPAAGSSFYMMVMLSDRHTGEAVTYAPVAATIKDASGKVVYRGPMQPTISAFEGPYYGNNVKLPGAGRYTLILRIDPPHQARHVEYQHVWLKPHTVVEHFTWSAGS